MSLRKLALSLGTISLIGLIVSSSATTTACAPPTSAVSDNPELPDSKSFINNSVSKFMERRCGSLDCHGQRGRPLRIYSEWGLRLEPGQDGQHDKGPTTDKEKLENYYAVVGLEPENLAKCFAQDTGGDFTTFQLLKKPLSIENGGIRHKGGPVLGQNQNDRGWKCLYGWACGQDFSKDDCEAASTL